MWWPLLVSAVVALGAGGCNGGDDGDAPKAPPVTKGSPAERAAVTRAVVLLLKSDDVRVVCQRTLTPRLFRQIFTGLAGCRKATTEDAKEDDSKPPKRVEVSDIRFTGRRATAYATIIGGDLDGAKGGLSLARGPGGWRTDDMTAALLRSVVAASLSTDDSVPKKVVRCITARFARLPDDQFKRVAYALLGHRPQGTAFMLNGLSSCEKGGSGVSSVRRRLERSVTKELQQADASSEEIGCALRRLRTTLPDKLFIRLLAEDTRRSKARIAREVVAAAVRCGVGNAPGPDQLSPA